MLHDFLTQAVHRSPDVPAISSGGATRTYGQLRHDATALAHSLRASGVRAGDRVIVLSPNTVTAAVGFWAVVMCGAVVVMINPRMPAQKLAWVLKDADAAALIADESLINVAVAAGLTNLGSVIVGARTEAQLRDNLAAINLQLSTEEHQRLERVSRPPLIYPFWHQRKTASDRLGIGDRSLITPGPLNLMGRAAQARRSARRTRTR